MIVVLEQDTAASALSCPGCARPLARWGFARARSVRCRGGRRVLVRPRRVRCRACQVTHVLLPAAVGAPRRADSVEVIGAGLLAAAHGHGHRPIAVQLGLPAGTVRGWIRSATGRAEHIRTRATALACQLDPMLDPPEPTGSRLGDVLAALGSAVAAAIRRFGPIAAPWQLAAIISGGLLGPGRRAPGS